MAAALAELAGQFCESSDRRCLLVALTTDAAVTDQRPL